jgi:hypothetical protein
MIPLKTFPFLLSISSPLLIIFHTPFTKIIAVITHPIALEVFAFHS